MREQRDAPAGERRAQRGVGEQAVDAEFHHGYGQVQRHEFSGPSYHFSSLPLVGGG